jgi:DNA polymerase I-like protein with 3'-5' exonuclease and polymerase domains
MTMQFGNAQQQWVFQWNALNDYQKSYIKILLESTLLLKLIHNAMFECVVCLFYDIRVQNVFDTMVAEQVLHGGEEIGYGLDDLCDRRLHITLDKTLQTAFGDNILTPAKVVYAAQDVKYLSLLKKDIYQQLQRYGLEWVTALEMSIIPALAEMVYHGMELDVKWWRQLEEEAAPLVGEAHAKLTAWINQEPFYTKAKELKYIYESDQLRLNWGSGRQKKEVFAHILPDIEGTSRAIMKSYISNCIKTNTLYPEWLNSASEGDYTGVTMELITNHNQWLIDREFLIPSGQCTINWNSTDQVLPIFKCVEPQLKNLSAESLGKTSHSIVQDYEDYKDTLKLISSFGEKFITKNLEPDGKIRTSFDQVKTTGRMSSSKPNMQQIPAKETVGNKYRNAFIAPKNFVYVSNDYISQELIIISYLSKDPVWLEALSKGQDLHSVAAELVFGRKWREAAEPDKCEYYFAHTTKDGKQVAVYSKVKCSCKKHKHMRNGVKTINFGLAYGMSKFKLASTLRITVQEAAQLIEDYFKAFPGIKGLLDYLGHFGVRNGYIQTIWPFYRRRWFPYWKWYTRFIDYHIRNIDYHGGLGEIERASKNMPIQGTSADLTKTAIYLIYEHIHEHKLEDKVYLVMQVHDQIDCIVHKDFAQEWAVTQTRIMEDAALWIIPTGTLKAEASITERWSK